MNLDAGTWILVSFVMGSLAAACCFVMNAHGIIAASAPVAASVATLVITRHKWMS